MKQSNFLWASTVFAAIFMTAFFSFGCRNGSFSLEAPGTIFIRQKAPDPKAYLRAFRTEGPNLKAHGFSAYSLHRDLNDRETFIITLKCDRLGEGVDFVRSPEFMASVDKADAQIPMVWYGLDTTERKYTQQPQMTGGIVIARNEVRDYKFWLDCFYKEDGGKHNHPGRKYKNSNYSIHHLPGKPEIAIVVHEASDVSKAPAFMRSEPMKGEMESTGVMGLDIWYGVNMQEGLF
ncbi:MAG TPA: hypothetical protein VMV05_09360 [bacterium]|nr:hypothetical protein [bacterium]